MLAMAPARARILVVDDEPEVRRGLQRLVTRFGYLAKAAASAEEADQWLTTERFDVCLLDIELPRMKGVEFLGWALSRDPEMAVIMLTGLDLPEVAIQCIDHGARSYLVKPVESDFLRLALRDALAVRRVLVERNDLAG
jgi:two-component system KDP operon response regulator KdpE